MEETDEKSEGGAGGAVRGADATVEGEAELRAEEESARAMEAEVPHPAGYPEPGQEKPS